MMCMYGVHVYAFSVCDSWLLFTWYKIVAIDLDFGLCLVFFTICITSDWIYSLIHSNECSLMLVSLMLATL